MHSFLLQNTWDVIAQCYGVPVALWWLGVKPDVAKYVASCEDADAIWTNRIMHA